MWHRRGNKNRAAEAALTAEAARLLLGRAADGCTQTQPIPAWVAINALAHSDSERLASMAGDWYRAPCGAWAATLGYLASQLLTLAPSDAELLELQREVLVPLELRLLDDPGAAPSTPGRMVALVMGAVRDRRIHRDG